MGLFVGAELLKSGQRSAGMNQRSDFRGQLAEGRGTKTEAPKATGNGQVIAGREEKPRILVSRPETTATPPQSAIRNPQFTSNTKHQTPTARSPVTLQPLEPDDTPAVSGEPKASGLANRLPSFVAPSPNAESELSKGIDAKLTRLQQNVDQLAQLQQNQFSQSVQKQQADQLQQQTQLLQTLQQANQLQLLQQQLLNMQNKDAAAPADGSVPGVNPLDAAKPQAADKTEEKTVKPDEAAEPSGPGVLKATPAEDGTERFSLNIKDAEISEVLEMIGQLSGLNILASKEVTGRITANLHLVNLDEALTAILKAGNFVFEKEGAFIYVTSAADAEAKAKHNRKIVTKVYRPHYISAKDLKMLITPMQTVGIGKSAVTNPNEIGIATGGEAAGGDNLVQGDALLVQDYAEVIAEIDRVLLEMDVPPQQVVIEATILSVTLNDQLKLGVNFSILGGANNQLVEVGNGQTLNGTVGSPGQHAATIVPPMGEFIANTAGLKYGFIRGDVGLFISALENVADTNLVATPRLMVLNKQRAELIIGERLSYKTLAFNGTQTVENVNFLDAGTKLRIRPFIAPDGFVRMEIHPEKSAATIDTKTGLPNASTTEVTSNVMVRDGTTIVIGGLIDETVQENYDRVPFLGALPVIGVAFRNKFESVVRRELIVLITPRIVDHTEAGMEGDGVKFENERRAEHFRDHLAPINRRNLARMQYENACYHFSRGNYFRARNAIRESLLINKNNLEALRLQDDIEQAIDGRTWPWSRSAADVDYSATEADSQGMPSAVPAEPEYTPPPPAPALLPSTTLRPPASRRL